MPGSEPVEQRDAEFGDAARDHVAQGRFLVESVTQAVCRAGSVSLFSGPVHIAEWPELFGCVPRIEAQLVYEPFGRPAIGSVDILPGYRQGCHSDWFRHLLLPSNGEVFDRR